MALEFTRRVRDLVHGYVYLTDLECRVMDHRLFQRLRHIRQNDVGSYVYPSLNTSRFEHSLGCAGVAGRMARNIQRGSQWGDYATALGLNADDFEQVCRLYALLHDVGHLPLSHLFEMAIEDFVERSEINLRDFCLQWFGTGAFVKAHEAFGATLTTSILSAVSAPVRVKEAIVRLTGCKELSSDDPLIPIKLLVDSEIDADRVDSTARDGRLAGGEYGNYDIERICSSVFVQRRSGGWCLGYSAKALGSLESMLLDRCRTHTWIHFHHRVAVVKVAASILIQSLLARKTIEPSAFSPTNPRLFAVDDVWLWSLLRGTEWTDPVECAARDLLFYRATERTLLLWKDRSHWSDLQDRVKSRAGLRYLTAADFGRKYERFASARLGQEVRVFFLHFKPLGKIAVPLTDENGDRDRGELLGHSALSDSLEAMWRREPQYYVVVFLTSSCSPEELEDSWVDATVEWLGKPSAERRGGH